VRDIDQYIGKILGNPEQPDPITSETLVDLLRVWFPEFYKTYKQEIQSAQLIPVTHVRVKSLDGLPAILVGSFVFALDRDPFDSWYIAIWNNGDPVKYAHFVSAKGDKSLAGTMKILLDIAEKNHEQTK
jgi:hypothetical protein